MALSGSYQKKPVSWVTLKTEWTATQSVADNTSTITCKHYLINTGGLSIGSRTGSCNAGGVTKSFSASSISGSGTKLLGTTTHTVNHNSDGTKTISFSTTFNIKATLSGTYYASITANGSATLDTIPRASGVSCNSFNIGDSTTITIDRKSSNFTHTLSYNFGSLNGVIATKTANTSVGWTAPTTFYGQIPNGRTGYGSITCQTYNGDTLIGTTSTSFNAYSKESDCIPDVSATITDTNSSTIALTGDSAKIIKYLSKPNATISATAKNSAGISSRSIVCGDGQSSTANTYTFSNGVTNSLFTATATDSRAYSKSISYNLSSLGRWVEYVKLAFSSISLTRPESTVSTATIIINGNFYNGSFGNANNSLSLKYRYKESGGSFGNYVIVTPTISGNTFNYTASISGINYQKEYVFEFVVSDSAMIVNSSQYILEKGQSIFRIGHDYTKTNGRILDHYGTELTNGLAIYKPNGVDIDPDTTLEEFILTETNTPGGFWYVRTMFFNTKSATSNRTQIAYPYAYNTASIKTGIYTRIYIDGIGWSAWSR